MSPCKEYQELISRMVDGDLSAKEERELSAHIASCPSCAALYRAFSVLSRDLGEDLEDAPFDLQDNVMAEIRREEIRRRNRLPVILRTVLSAAACVAVIVGVYLGVSLTRGAHLGVAAYQPSADSAAVEAPVVVPTEVPSQNSLEMKTAPSLSIDAMDDAMQESNAPRGGLPGGGLGAAAPEAAAEAETGGAFGFAAPAATPAPVWESSPEEAEWSVSEDAAAYDLAEEAKAEEAAPAEAEVTAADLREWRLPGSDLSHLRNLLRGEPTELSQEDLEDALFGRILLQDSHGESWTVLLYRQDEVLYFLDPVEDTVYRSGLTQTEWEKFFR